MDFIDLDDDLSNLNPHFAIALLACIGVLVLLVVGLFAYIIIMKCRKKKNSYPMEASSMNIESPSTTVKCLSLERRKKSRDFEKDGSNIPIIYEPPTPRKGSIDEAPLPVKKTREDRVVYPFIITPDDVGWVVPSWRPLKKVASGPKIILPEQRTKIESICEESEGGSSAESTVTKIPEQERF